jgi:hypothetical protein
LIISAMAHESHLSRDPQANCRRLAVARGGGEDDVLRGDAAADERRQAYGTITAGSASTA